MRLPLVHFVFLLLAFFSLQNLYAQIATGTYVYGSFDSLGIDTINVGNLNSHITIPVINKPGRGLPFYYNLSYDSSVWSPAVVNGSTVWTLAPAAGWRGDTEISTGYLSFNEITSNQRTGSNICSTIIFSNYVYHDPFGVAHGFNAQETIHAGSCTGTTGSLNATATDGSGYSLSGGATVITRDGRSFSPPQNVNGGAAASISDLNGNQVSVSASGVFTDSLGKTALTVTNPSSSQQAFTYTDTNGNPQAVKVNYSSYTVQTAFGCASLSDYGPLSNQLISSISLPDGTSYSMTYESTPGVPGNVTGRLASITQPQGGVISYRYTGGSNGINCSDGSATGLTREISGGSRTYVRSSITSTSSQTQTTDGLGNVTVSNFVFAGTPLAAYETQRQVTEAGGGTPLLNRNTCYNAASAPCTTTALTLPIAQIDTYQLANGIEENGSTYKYNSYGLETEEDDYDYGGSAARGSLLRKEVWTYPSSGVVNLVSQDEVYDGSGNVAGLTAYAYDGAAVTATSGLPQHSGTIGPQRGNLTSSSQYYSGGAALSGSATYEDTGDVLTSTGPNGKSQYSYDTNTHAFVVTATPPTPSSGVSLATGASNDPNTGAILSSTDPNNQTVTYKSYDSRLRPLEIDNPDGGKSTFFYSPAQVGQYIYQNSSVFTDVEQLYDGYGRPIRIAVSNGQSSNPWYQQDTCYDAAGNASFVSTYYQGSGFGPSAVCSNNGTAFTYDGLGRATLITYGDGTTKHFTYVGRATQSTDENGVIKISQVDGLGRTTAVCEVSSSTLSGGGTPAACGLDIAGTGYLTSYAYALATGTTTITQGAQTRVFQTDWLGRTVSVHEPESGVTTYSYAYNSTGLQVTRKSPTVNQTSSSTITTATTQYDSIGRPLTVTYSDGTPAKNFLYDQAIGWSGTTQLNVKGRLSYADRLTAGGSDASLFGYDSMGRVTNQYTCTPSLCGSGDYSIGYTYNWQGSLTSEGDGGGDTYTYSRSLAGEITGITSSFSDSTDPGNIIPPGTVANTVFGPGSYTLGNNLATVRTYDSMGRNNGGWVCSGTTQAYCSNGSQVYGYTAQFSGVQKTGGCDTVVNNCSYYGYDNFNRLASSSTTGGITLNLAFSYDRYGNRWNQTVATGSGPQPQLTFNTATNQQIGLSYDAAGNVTYDGIHSYTYDADNNVISVDGGSTAKYYYDSLNERVGLVRGGSGGSYEFVFDAMGRRVSTWIAGTHAFSEALVYSDTGPVAFRAGGSTHFQHQSYLGTARVNTGYSGSTEGTFSSLPFGDDYMVTGEDWDWAHFAGTDYDAESSTQHAQFRQYASSTGHWMSPDPYYGSYKLRNPQSLNRYAYAANNPMSFSDPSGLDIPDSGEDGGDNPCDNPAIVCADPPPIDGGGGSGSGDSGGSGSGDSGSNPGQVANPGNPFTVQGPGLTGCGASCNGQFDLLGFNPSGVGLTGVQYFPAPNNPFKKWPLNGNITPDTHQQDQKCSAGPVIGPVMDSLPGVLDACQWHDNKYMEYNCNATSWMSPFPGPCKLINYILLIKIYNALPLKPF